MKNILLYIFLFVSIVILLVYLNQSTSIEAFEQSNVKTIVLLGDSILKNNSYVTKGVDELLNDSTECSIVSLARDKTTIGHTYKQIEEIPESMNDSTTVLVLSAGGNDIIEDYINGPYDADEDQTQLNRIFGSYKLLIKALRTKMDKARIFLLDIYYPTNNQYKEFYPLIKGWNDMQSEYLSGTQDRVIKISESLTKPQDFAFDIEPSDKGGKKVVDAILSSIE
jgi:hypothetical protein